MKGSKRPTVGLSMKLYRDLSRTMRSFELDTVAEEILKSMKSLLGVDYGSLLLMTDQGQYLERIFRIGFGPERHVKDRFGLSKGEIEGLIRDMIPKIIQYESPDAKGKAPVINGTRLGSLAMFPFQLVYGYSALLLLGVNSERLTQTLMTRDGFAQLEAILNDYSFALKNALTVRRMNELITKDDLTLACNRRFFETYMEEEIERARRYNNPLSIIFLDLDGLREVNNRFGHAMGSRTLQEAAARVMNAVRSIDKVVRYGGDEFCIILPETEWMGALEVAERIRARLSSTPFLLDETGGVEITASFGVAAYPVHALTKEELVKKADEAMYLIKTETKNDIRVAQPLKRYP